MGCQDVFGELDNRDVLDSPPRRHRRHLSDGHDVSGQFGTLDSPPRRQKQGRKRHRAAWHDAHDASALRLPQAPQADEEEALSPVRQRDFSGLLDDDTPPSASSFQYRDRPCDDREDELSFDQRHASSSFEEGGHERDLFDEDGDDGDLWRECPTSASPPGSPEFSIPRRDDRFPRHQDSPGEDDREDGASSPMASFWARRGSPSYSPAPQRAFNWRPSLSPRLSRGRDEDPFAYVPQSTLLAPRGEDEDGDASSARSACCTSRSPRGARSRRPPPPSPAPSPAVSGKMILCLSPAERSTPPPNVSKWHGYMG
ncbi:uncharacterized protein LOC117652897 [Thrips palmi]|uniref:Uncharacterized protein LOC117652897 n=1 Tax=Thrips palmi TaxID=161013 RepID=A0A6P9A7S8_THRPL|nr:uncharacterized protein LOC117652897 [Thrips palmi]